MKRRAERWGLLLLVFGPTPGFCATVATLDGRALAGGEVTIQGERLVMRGETGPVSLPLTEVRSVDFQRPSGELMDRPGRHVVFTDDGSLLGVENDAILDGKLKARALCGFEALIPQERIELWLRARAQERPAELEKRLALLKVSRGDQDCVVLSKHAQHWAAVQGILVAAEAVGIRFSYQGTETVFDPAHAPIVVMARMGELKWKPRGALATADGGRLAFSELRLDAQGAELQSPSLGKLRLALRDVASISFQSDRLACLSDLAPAEMKQTGFFDERFPPRKNACADGGPLRLGGTVFARGLGLHSACEITYPLGGQYRVFTALAGLDDSGLGSAHLSLWGDGKELLPRTRLERGRPPRTLRVELAGVRSLSIRVDFGDETCGAGERVDLVEPWLVK